MIKKNKTVFVGISGGVDSAVSAAMLKDEGYNVVGVFIRTWTPDFIKCTWQNERRDAMRICAHLNIPFLECDAEKAYKNKVADYMIEEYKNGRTPNPDVMCNREVKFGVFWNFAKEKGADYIATGHYAQNNYELKIKNYQLKKGKDDLKDQVYFLWTLTQDDLSHILFPVGYLNKTEVRKKALKYKIPIATKKDSQGVCFLGPLDMKDFLSHYLEIKNGDVINNKGEVIGSHGGAIFFTLGERHGFNIFKHSKNDQPLYVIAKDIEKNTITVSALLENSSISLDNQKNFSKFLKDTNWIIIPTENKKYTAQIRYHGELLNCHIFGSRTSKNVEVVFEKEIMVDKGQSVVIYDGDICLGGGILE